MRGKINFEALCGIVKKICDRFPAKKNWKLCGNHAEKAGKWRKMRENAMMRKYAEGNLTQPGSGVEPLPGGGSREPQKFGPKTNNSVSTKRSGRTHRTPPNPTRRPLPPWLCTATDDVLPRGQNHGKIMERGENCSPKPVGTQM